MKLVWLLSHEWRTRLSRPVVLAALGSFVVVLSYAGFNGRAHLESRRAAIAIQEEEVSTAMGRWRNDLGALDNARGSAMNALASTHLPAAPLADFSIGQSDLLPHLAVVSLWKPDLNLFARYELEDPVALRFGGFDLSQAILLLLPLLLIVLCFDVLSTERDSHRLGLLLAQGARLPTILWSRLLIRAAVVLVLTLLATLPFLVFGHSAMPMERLADFAWWVMGQALYALFWTALVGFVAASRQRGEANVLQLLLAWASFTLLVPAAVAAVAEAVSPAPSRLSYLAEARETEIRTELTEGALTQRFLRDHPELAIDEASQIPAYFRTAFFVTSEVDRATRPIVAAFEDAAVQRERTLGILRYLSPAIVVHAFSSEVAGTSSTRYRRYAAGVRMLKADYARWAAPSLVGGRRPSLEEAAALPRFELEDDGPDLIIQRNALALLWLGLSSAFLLVLTQRRLRSCASPRCRPRGARAFRS